MKRTKFVTLCLALIMILLCFASCGGNQTAKPSTMGKESEATQPQTPTPQTPTPEPPETFAFVGTPVPYECEFVPTDTNRRQYDYSFYSEMARTAKVIQSSDELAAYFDDMEDAFEMDLFRQLAELSFDEAFFSQKLLVVTFMSTTSCCMPSVVELTLDEGELIVYRDRVDDHEICVMEQITEFTVLKALRPEGEVHSARIESGKYEKPQREEDPNAKEKKYSIPLDQFQKLRFNSFDKAVEYFSTVNLDEIEDPALYAAVSKILKQGYIYNIKMAGDNKKAGAWVLRYGGNSDPYTLLNFSTDEHVFSVYLYLASEWYNFETITIEEYCKQRYDMDVSLVGGHTLAIEHPIIHNPVLHRASPVFGKFYAKCKLEGRYYLDVWADRCDKDNWCTFLESLQFEKVYFERPKPYDYRTDPNVTVLPTNTACFERSFYENEDDRPYGAVLFTDAKAAQDYLNDVVVWKEEEFSEYCQKYDDAFFEDNILIIYIETTSSCCQFNFPAVGMVNDPANNTPQMTLFIARHEDEYHTDDLINTIHFIEVETTESITDISQIATKFIAQ